MNTLNYYVDNEKQEICFDDNSKVPLYSKKGFMIISDLWVKVGWDQKHLYGFTWLGRPIIQIPDDMVRLQEAIYSVKPDVIVETGIAHGGSLIFSASLCKMIGKGRVIGVDIEIRPHNRKEIERHELFNLITMYEGSSIDGEIFSKIKSEINKTETALIILDSCHDYDHVLRELEIYSQLLSSGSYIIATDGSQQYLNVTPRAKKEYKDCDNWDHNNPKKAAEDFVIRHPEFEIVEPNFPFNEGNIDFRVTHWPSAYIQRKNI